MASGTPDVRQLGVTESRLRELAGQGLGGPRERVGNRTHEGRMCTADYER
jgi:hypothetical protein